jgi:hypothetical protein
MVIVTNPFLQTLLISMSLYFADWKEEAAETCLFTVTDNNSTSTEGGGG